MFKPITSTGNPLIKELFTLKEKSRTRKKSGLFLIEGQREISLAIKGGYTIEKILVDWSIISNDQFQHINEHIQDDVQYFELSNEVYKKLAFRGTTEGIIAVVRFKELSLNSFELTNNNPLILVAEAPEKPGNIGALLRTVDAAGIDAVFIANPKTDMYNPNIIRSSVGCIFTTNIATGTTEEIIQFLKENNIHIYGAALSASAPYDTINYKQASAIVVGTEATGLTSEWLENSTQNIIIPMRGQIDSMNVSVSAAIILFEAVRQRNL